ncbi:Predicted arabinose efflux permease, MFS family [Devosia lucknowensis]|uniref:Predicted arabinose efflux permease, MFS family n=1 Tax=Devosia lucknowensis TaxID=1096929 RepID=A0A1Y6EII0_9HYPH|nr:MFS transporter [Devosia lucknowensis]SMQ62404.1 Predicted arabinose efflux permease, MFS family [Devosia lucknowensis]
MAQTRLPVTAMLGTSMFFSGVTYAATMPYASLVGVDTLGMSPGFFAAVMSTGAIVGTFVSLGLGFLSDKVRDRRLLVLLTALSGVLAHGLIYLFPSQLSFAIAMALIMPFAGASYGQSFGYLRVYYLKHLPARADFMVTAMRTVFTVAWIVVPPLAGWIAAEYDIFDVYLASTLGYAVVAGVFALFLADPTTAVQIPVPPRAEGASLLSVFALRPGILAGLAGLVIMTGSLRLMNLTMSLFIVGVLGGSLADVGLYAGITAATEAPFMLLLAWLTTRVTKETLLACAGLVVALFIGLASQLTNVNVLFWLLFLNGLGTAALMSVNISYVQDAIKGRVGLSTSLMDLVAIGANLLGAGAFGLLASSGDYRTTLIIAAAIAVVGAATMAIGNLPRLGRLKAVAA